MWADFLFAWEGGEERMSRVPKPSPLGKVP